MIPRTRWRRFRQRLVRSLALCWPAFVPSEFSIPKQGLARERLTLPRPGQSPERSPIPHATRRLTARARALVKSAAPKRVTGCALHWRGFSLARSDFAYGEGWRNRHRQPQVLPRLRRLRFALKERHLEPSSPTRYLKAPSPRRDVRRDRVGYAKAIPESSAQASAPGRRGSPALSDRWRQDFRLHPQTGRPSFWQHRAATSC